MTEHKGQGGDSGRDILEKLLSLQSILYLQCNHVVLIHPAADLLFSMWGDNGNTPTSTCTQSVS